MMAFWIWQTGLQASRCAASWIPRWAPAPSGRSTLGVSVALREGDVRFLLPPTVEALRIYDLEGRAVWTAPEGRGGEVHFETPRSGVWFWQARGGGLDQIGKFVAVR